MVSPDGFVDSGSQVLNVLPTEVAQDVLFIIQALGGLFVIYLIFIGFRIYYHRKQVKAIEEIREDIKNIKKKLEIK